MRSCIESAYTAVRHFAVAIPAESPVIGVSHFGSYLSCLYFTYQSTMAADTVFLYYLLPWGVHFNHLRLHTEGEHRGVAKTVVRFKIIFAKNVVVRHVAIVTHGIATVRGVHPRSILRLHNMAVHTRLGVVGQIGVRFRYIKNIPAKPYQYPY